MTRKEAIKNLIVMVVIGIVIATVLVITGGDNFDISIVLLLAVPCGGLPTAWKFVTKIFMPTNFLGVCLVFVASFLIGLIAFPIGVIKYVYYIIKNQ